jgi:hypothetical protein
MRGAAGADPINVAAKPNIFRGKGGSEKRD